MFRKMWETVKIKSKKSQNSRKREKEKQKKKVERKQKKEKKKKHTREKIMEVIKVAKKWEIQDKKEEVVKKLILEQFHKWIKVFRKKASERMLIRKMQDYMINLK